MDKFLKTPLGQSLLHGLKVAGFLALTAFLTSLVGFLANDPTISGYVATHPFAALAFAVVNILLASGVKYSQVR